MNTAKKKYRAFITDFDGTLIKGNLSLSPQVKQKVLDLINQGFIFSIATGRPYHGIVRHFCHDLNLTSPQIVSGGARIIDPQTDQVLSVNYMLAKTVENIINYFLSKSYRFGVESGEDVFTLNAVVMEEYGPGSKFKDLTQLNDHTVYKIVLFSDSEQIKTEEENLKKSYPDLHIIKGGYNKKIVFDITSANSTKHLAVLKLAELLDINPQEMIGVGDGYNDYPLLSACGYKIAMGNAPVELKEIADLVVPDADHDGLVEAIEYLIKI